MVKSEGLRLSPYEEASLEWYFGPGAAQFERSTMGAMLERAYAMSVDHKPDNDTIRARFERLPHEPPAGEITARPTAELRQSAGYTPNEQAMARFAHVSRRLRLVRAESAGAERVLAAYYGDVGCRWGRTARGRIFAVLPLTQAGQNMLRKATKRTAKAPLIRLTETEALENEVDLERLRPDPSRAQQIESARRQAGKLYHEACAAYVRSKITLQGEGVPCSNVAAS
jgi:hypothetical protein